MYDESYHGPSMASLFAERPRSSQPRFPASKDDLLDFASAPLAQQIYRRGVIDRGASPSQMLGRCLHLITTAVLERLHDGLMQREIVSYQMKDRRALRRRPGVTTFHRYSNHRRGSPYICDALGPWHMVNTPRQSKNRYDTPRHLLDHHAASGICDSPSHCIALQQSWRSRSALGSMCSWCMCCKIKSTATTSC